jgi:hypothetical protein
MGLGRVGAVAAAGGTAAALPVLLPNFGKLKAIRYLPSAAR